MLQNTKIDPNSAVLSSSRGQKERPDPVTPTIAAALLASLPLTSLLAIIWLYADTRDTGQVISLTHSILWAVIPSLLFFIALPLFLRVMSFVPALLAACAVTMAGYGIYVLLLGRFGIRL